MSMSPVQAGSPLSPLSHARQVEHSRAEEKTESRAREAAETAADQAKKPRPAPAPLSRNVDTYA
jgi:hypothetical protein